MKRCSVLHLLYGSDPRNSSAKRKMGSDPGLPAVLLLCGERQNGLAAQFGKV